MPPPDGRRRLGAGGGGAAVRALRKEVEELRNSVFEVMQLLRAALGSGLPAQPGHRRQKEPTNKVKKNKMSSSGTGTQRGDGPGAGGGSGAGGSGAMSRAQPSGRAAGTGGGGAMSSDRNPGGAVGAGAHGGTATAGAGVLGMFTSRELAEATRPTARVSTTAKGAAAKSTSLPPGWKLVSRKPRTTAMSATGAASASSGTAPAAGVPSAEGGQQRREDKEEPKGEAKPEERPRMALHADGWSVPVLDSAGALQAGGRGVALATAAEALAAKAQLRAAGGALAAVVARPLAGAAPMEVTILHEGKLRVQRCFVLQLGTTQVTYAPAGTRVQAASTRVSTEVLAVTIEKGHTELQHWQSAEANPVLTFSKWFKHHEVQALELFRPLKEGNGQEARISVLARVPKSVVAKALNASGADGVFLRTLGPQALAVVWSDAEAHATDVCCTTQN